MITSAQAGSFFIISGPSGSGKGTVVKSLAASSDEFALSISVTTRSKRDGEEDGVHYFFKTPEQFIDMRDNGLLLEHTLFVGNMYGTPRSYVEDKIADGKTVLLEIEVNGALQVKNKYPDCVLIFLIPPSSAELQHRLLSRGTEDFGTVRARMNRAKEEIALIHQYDYLIINDKVEKAVESIQRIAAAERLKTTRYHHLSENFFME
jgi:guanylate kinase